MPTFRALLLLGLSSSTSAYSHGLITMKTTAAASPYSSHLSSPKAPPSPSSRAPPATSCRRHHLAFSLSLGIAVVLGNSLSRPSAAQARTEPLGVINELLADCPPEGQNCASTIDDRPAVFQEPWQYDSTTEKAMKKLRRYVEAMGNVEVITADDRYLRAEVKDGKAIDDLEFYFTPDDAIIQFRSARRPGTGGDRGANLKRMEKIRIALGFEKIPVLRNRRRALFFLETPFDSFGPTYGQDAPIPEELGQVYSDADPFSPTWEGPPAYPRSQPKKQ